MEGITIFKIYLKYFGFYNFMTNKKLIPNKVGYVEFHGEIKKRETKPPIKFTRGRIPIGASVLKSIIKEIPEEEFRKARRGAALEKINATREENGLEPFPED